MILVDTIAGEFVKRVLMLWMDSNPSTMEKNHLMLMGLMEHNVEVIALGLCHSARSREYFDEVYGEEAGYQYDFGVIGSLYEGKYYITKLLNNLRIALLFSLKLIRLLFRCDISTIIIPSQPLELTLPALILGRLTGTNIVPNIMEYYPALPTFYNRKNLFQRWSWKLVLRYSHGFIVISRYLEEKLKADGARNVFRLPALLPDAKLIAPSDLEGVVSEISNLCLDNPSVPIFIFTSSSAYDDLLEFCIDSLADIHDQKFLLVITGKYSDELKALWEKKAVELGMGGKIKFSGFLTDAQLLELQNNSTALLIPLLDNDRHQARFPQKIFSYMQLGKPIIATDVGEFKQTLSDGATALLATDATVASYARKINYAIDHPVVMREIGLRGRDFVKDNFSYRYWGGKLKEFLGRIEITND